MNSETAYACYQAEKVFARYKDTYGFIRRSGVSRSLYALRREDWDEMNGKFDMSVLLFQDELLRHFLPRLLEWLCEEDADVLDLSVRLNHMHWLDWPAEEIEALRAVFEAWAREKMDARDGQFPIGFWLELRDDPSRYLDIWLHTRPHEFAKWLWIVNWEKHENVRLWVSDPHVEELLEAAFFRDPLGLHATLLSRSIELIRSLRG